MLKSWTYELDNGDAWLSFQASERGSGKANEVKIEVRDESIVMTPNDMDQIVAAWLAMRKAEDDAQGKAEDIDIPF